MVVKLNRTSNEDVCDQSHSRIWVQLIIRDCDCLASFLWQMDLRAPTADGPLHRYSGPLQLNLMTDGTGCTLMRMPTS